MEKKTQPKGKSRKRKNPPKEKQNEDSLSVKAKVVPSFNKKQKGLNSQENELQTIADEKSGQKTEDVPDPTKKENQEGKENETSCSDLEKSDTETSKSHVASETPSTDQQSLKEISNNENYISNKLDDVPVMSKAEHGDGSNSEGTVPVEGRDSAEEDARKLESVDDKESSSNKTIPENLVDTVEDQKTPDKTTRDVPVKSVEDHPANNLSKIESTSKCPDKSVLNKDNLEQGEPSNQSLKNDKENVIETANTLQTDFINDSDEKAKDSVGDSERNEDKVEVEERQMEITDSQLCEAVQRQESVDSCQDPGSNIQRQYLEGRKIVRDLIVDLSYLNKMLLRTKREIEATRRRRQTRT